MLASLYMSCQMFKHELASITYSLQASCSTLNFMAKYTQTAYFELWCWAGSSAIRHSPYMNFEPRRQWNNPPFTPLTRPKLIHVAQLNPDPTSSRKQPALFDSYIVCTSFSLPFLTRTLTPGFAIKSSTFLARFPKRHGCIITCSALPHLNLLQHT
jgi:hypothetical protein